MINLLTIVFWFVFPAIVLIAGQFFIKYTGITKFIKINVADLATAFLIFGIFEITRRLFKVSILPNFFLSLLLLALTIIVFQIFYYQEFFYGKFFKMFWRMTFLFSVLVYVVCWLVMVAVL